MTITIPENLSEITLKQYIDFNNSIKEDSSQSYVSRMMIKHFCNIKEDIRDIPMSKFNDTIEIITKTLNQEPKFKQTFIMDGVTYGFIPKLDEIPFGEFIDLENYLSDEDTFNRAMAVMYRPVTIKKNDMYLIEKYDGSDKYEEVMNESPLEVFMGAMVFFYTLGKELLKATTQSLKEEVSNIPQSDSLVVNGVGINQYMHSLEQILDDLMISHRWN